MSPFRKYGNRNIFLTTAIDGEKDMVSAGIIITEADGEQTFVVKEVTTFTDDLYGLKSWLSSHA